jgi:REP element-mobilizing transposase RayT
MSLRRTGRLPGFEYQGHFVYALTLCAFASLPRFNDAEAVSETHRFFCHAADRWAFQLLAHCYMPNHVHLIAYGIEEHADLRRFIHDAKQRSGYWHSQNRRSRLWQESYFDHIIRDEESVQRQVCYVLNNPVRAGLVSRWDQWPHSGTTMSIAVEDFQRAGLNPGRP